MKPSTSFLLMAVMLAAAGLTQLDLMPKVTPQSRPVGPDLVATISKAADGTKAAEDYRRFGYMCKKMAATIRWDGKQAEPKLVSGTTLHNYRVLDREAMFDGRELAPDYPHLKDAVRDYLIAKVGTENKKLTPEQREVWAKTYDEIGDNAIYAADSQGWVL